MSRGQQLGTRLLPFFRVSGLSVASQPALALDEPMTWLVLVSVAGRWLMVIVIVIGLDSSDT